MGGARTSRGAVPLRWVVRVGLGWLRHPWLGNELFQLDRGIAWPFLHLQNYNQVN